MKIEININITGTDNLSDAINNLAKALYHPGLKPAPFATVENTVPFTKTEAPAPEQPDAPKLSAGEQKQIIADKIAELGFEPPEKGTLATFQKALEDAQAKPAQEKPEATATPPEAAQEDPEESPEEITEESTRNLAVFLIENHPDPSLAKSIFGAILQKAGVKAITGANDQALAVIHPRLKAAVEKLQVDSTPAPTEDEDGL